MQKRKALSYAATNASKRATKRIPKAESFITETVRHYAECRSLGHQWQHVGPDMGAAEFGAYGFRSQCGECGTMRTKWVTRSGVVRPAKYTYPKDYATTGDAKLSGQQWRRALIVSMIGDE